MKYSKYHFDWADPKSHLLFENETDYFKVEKRFVKQAECLISNFELHAGDLILDFGCGIGKHAICLAKKGYNVIGYDISEHYIKNAQKLIRQEGVEVQLLHSIELLDDYYGQFDFIYTIDFPFYYLDEKSIPSTFRKINDLLSDEAKFLFGFPYTRENREHYLPINKWEEKHGVLYLTDETIDTRGRRSERYVIIDRENDTFTEWADGNTYYYVSEIQHFLEKAEFNIIDQFENLEKKRPCSAIDVHYMLCEKMNKSH